MIIGQLEMANALDFVNKYRNNINKIIGEVYSDYNVKYVFINFVDILNGYHLLYANDNLTKNMSLVQSVRLKHIKSLASQFFAGNPQLREISLPNLTTISGGSYLFDTNTQLREISFPNLTTISGSSYLFNNNSQLREISFPNLTTISGGSYLFRNNSQLREISFPNLTTISNTSSFISSCINLQKLSLPNLITVNSPGYFITAVSNQSPVSIDLRNLKISTHGIFSNSAVTVNELKLDSFEEFVSNGYVFLARIIKDEIALPKLHKCTNLISSSAAIKTLHIGDGMRNGVAGDINIAYDTLTKLTTLNVANGFKAKLNLTGCNGLSREVLVDIINNLADLTGETSLNLIMGATLLAKLTDADKAIATQKNWTLS